MHALPCRARRVRALAAAARSGAAAEEGAASSSSSSSEPDVEAESGGCVGLEEAEVTQGRPNIPALLARICKEHAAEQEIGVIVAGARSCCCSPLAWLCMLLGFCMQHAWSCCMALLQCKA
jgi:hypothetical protein